MPDPSVAFPAIRLRRTVDADLRERFERVAGRGAARLGVRIDPALLREHIAAAPPTPTLPTPERVAAPVAPEAPTAPPRAAAAVAPTPAPAPVRLIPRAMSLGGMEDPMQQTYSDYQMGALQLPTQLIRRQAVARTAPAPAPTSYVGGYPTIREEEKADWTTYAMIGAAVLLLGGGVYYAKKKKII